MEAVKICIFWLTSSADHSARHCSVLILGCNAQPGVQLSFQLPCAVSSPRPGTGLGLVAWLRADQRGVPGEMGAFWGALSKTLPAKEGTSASNHDGSCSRADPASVAAMG